MRLLLLKDDRNTKPSLRFNAFMSGILAITNVLFPIITFAYISRILMVDSCGRITFAQSIVALFAMFAQLGVPSYGIRECAKVRENKKQLEQVFAQIFGISLLCTLVTFIGLCCFILLYKSALDVKLLLFVFGLDMVFNTFGVNWFYQGLEQYLYITSRSVFFRFLGIALMMAIVKGPEDVVKYSIIILVTNSCGYILNTYNLRKYISLKRVKFHGWKSHIRPIFIIFFTTLAINIYTNLDVIMLGAMHGNYEVGIFQASVKIKSILTTLISSVILAISPRMSHLFALKNEDEIRLIIGRMFRLVMIFALPMTLVCAYYAPLGISIIAGNQFLDAVMPMRILAPIIFISAFSQVIFHQILMPNEKEFFCMIAVSVGAVVDLVLNIILIPQFGFVGAAISTLVAEIAQCTIQIIFARKYVFHCIQKGVFFKVAIASCVALFCSSIAYTMLRINVFLLIFVVACVFAIIYYVSLQAMGINVLQELGFSRNRRNVKVT
jgi:O-antigen/teichoic acid export membrane protein